MPDQINPTKNIDIQEQENLNVPEARNLNDVFTGKSGTYLNEFTLFTAHFNCIPNFVHEIEIDCRRAQEWFSEAFKSQIRDTHFDMRCFNGSRIPEYDDVFHILFEDLIVNFDTSADIVRFLFRKTSLTQVQEIQKGIRMFRQKNSTTNAQVRLLVSGPLGPTAKRLDFSTLQMNLSEHYNDDFMAVHDRILKRLTSKNDKGIVLLHGKPGTGKTSYIRYLISRLWKEVIFLPPNLAANITNPELLNILTEHPNCILIIEDAENIILNRNQEAHSPVSTLLNLSDGLLSDCLNIQIICSFNTDLTRVDPALLRKGRLIAKYEFKELQAAKAQALSGKIGYATTITTPMTLAAIYNQGDIDYNQNHQTIGFRSAV